MRTRKQRETDEVLRREISRIILYELNDPRMGFVTLTRVETGSDLRSARIFVTVRGSETEKKLTLSGLEHARGHVQALLGERLKVRYTPVLVFLEDRELGRAAQVEQLLSQVKREREAEKA